MVLVTGLPFRILINCVGDKTGIIAHIHGTIAHEKSNQPLTEGHVLWEESQPESS